VLQESGRSSNVVRMNDTEFGIPSPDEGFYDAGIQGRLQLISSVGLCIEYRGEKQCSVVPMICEQRFEHNIQRRQFYRTTIANVSVECRTYRGKCEAGRHRPKEGYDIWEVYKLLTTP
jgi:hypothetical protein